MIIEIDKKEWDRCQELIRKQTERIEQLCRENQQQADHIEQLEQLVQQLKKMLEARAETKSAKMPKFTENYSLERNKRNHHKKKRSNSRRTDITRRS